MRGFRTSNEQVGERAQGTRDQRAESSMHRPLTRIQRPWCRLTGDKLKDALAGKGDWTFESPSVRTRPRVSSSSHGDGLVE